MGKREQKNERGREGRITVKIDDMRDERQGGDMP